MQFAYQFPERCERLVLVASGGVGRAVNPVLRALSAPGADWVLPTALAVGDAPMVPGTLRQFGRVAKAFGLGIGTDADDLINGYTRLKDPVARKAFFRTLRSVVDPRGQHVTMLDRCYLTRGMPTMLMWGGHDPIIPSSHAYVARAAMPGSRLEMFPQAGHFPHRYDPQRFAHTVHDFVANTPPAVHDAYTWRTLLRDGPAATVASQPSFVAAAAAQSGHRSGV
jgi:pimeloyl-ACP methyl ester carboxylesterase